MEQRVQRIGPACIGGQLDGAADLAGDAALSECDTEAALADIVRAREQTLAGQLESRALQLYLGREIERERRAPQRGLAGGHELGACDVAGAAGAEQRDRV